MKKLIGVLVVVLLLPSTAFEYDLTEFEMAIVPRWLELFSVDYERGIFSLEPGGPPDLYGTLDAIHILFACGHILNNTWASTINSYQEKMTGNYRLSPNAPGRQPYHSAALATATLELLGQRPAYSNRGFENTLRENLTRVFDPLYESACWSKKIRGNNIHECGQIIGSYPVVLFDNEDFFRWWTKWLLEKTHRTLGVLCPVSNDLYARIQCVGGSMPTYGVALGGGSKLPFPGNSLHFAIETQQDSNGTWSDQKNLQKLMGSLTLDGIVLATRSALQLKSQSALDSARISCKTMLGIVVPQLTNATLIFHDSLYAATSHNLPNVVAAVAQCAQTFPDLVKTTRPWSCCARYV